MNSPNESPYFLFFTQEGTVAMVKLSSLTELITFITSLAVVQARYLGKRESNRDYYTLHLPQGELEAVQQIAQQLGVRLEGQVGELDTYYMVSSLKSPFQKRDEEDRVLTDFDKYKRLSASKWKRDEQVWTKVQSIEKQIPKRRVKRGPIPPLTPKEIAIETRKALNIKDPLFDKQWHLVINTVLHNNKSTNTLVGNIDKSEKSWQRY